ncbi:unnamed protein product [Ceratitis capitata]|uniref:(Mediterranean fruit fly) hypothetical protein n=1 Tax=Ceratitis capitata TaxID=7213 RepID=A0A811U2U5_CERCA|nr:unnamed protein product [Ceratitis capitata]
MQQVVTTKEKSKFTEWTDNLFVQLYWLPLPRYKRPTNNELQKASEFFIYHYVHQSGELSDWRNTLQILLLGLSINHNNLPVYILANEDELKAVDSEIQLPWNDATTTVPEYKNDHSFKKSANKCQAWCYSELIRGNIAVVRLISLYLCSQSVANATNVNCDFRGVTKLFRTHFSTGKSSWPITPLPGKILFKELKVIFNCSEQFAKQLICRVTQRRLQISRVLRKNLRRKLIEIQDAACYRSFEERGAGLWILFERAQNILRVKDETLLNRLSELVELKDSVEALKSITPFDRTQKTWVIANLLQKSAYSNLCINNIENLLMIATCFVIVYNITDKNNEIWTHQIFAFDRLRQEGLLKRAISVGQSLRREVKLNTKPKAQQVVTTKEKSKFTEWTDNLFVQLYWLPLLRYKRPTNNELQKASEFFIYHYVHQSGELSDWRNTLQILLLGLSINHKNRPVYILANEDELKAVDSEIQLPWNDATTTVPEYKNDHSFKKSANKWQAWCYSELIRGNIAVVSNYLGLISLYLCSQSVANATDVNCDFTSIRELLRTHFSTGESSWPITPLPGKILFKEFKVIFNYSEQFAKQLICRVTQRRLQISRVLPMNLQHVVIKIQDAACYRRFEECGTGLWLWFTKAKSILKVKDETLFNRLSKLVELKDSVEALKSITPFDRKQKTWVIANLLQKSAYSNLCINNIENLLMIATCFVIVYNITDKNNEIWTHQIFAFDRLRQEGLLKRAISVGQSLRREVKLNTKPQTNNYIGETQQVVTTKEESKFTEWTDNLFVQLYWLPLPRYKRPTKNELQKASEFFIYHYVHQSGELSDWRNTLHILLLGLSINHNNLPVYILANEDELKAVDSEIQLPWNDATTTLPEYKNDHSFKKSANKWQAWCYSELIRGNIAVVSNYLGLISLYLCSQSVAAATDVSCDFTGIIVLLQTHFSTGESSWPRTPLPGKTLFKAFKVIFNYSEQFAKQLICRVAQRRLQIKQELPMKFESAIIVIQNVAFYKRFEEHGDGMWHWFCRAKGRLNVSGETLLEMLTVAGITPFDLKQQTWPIASLLRNEYYSNLGVKKIENLLAIAIFMVVYYNITDKNNKIWTNRCFEFDRLKQEGLLERAISVGQSLRREVKLNTKPKTNNCIGETHQVVTTKEKSKFSEWTDNLFVQLYWLPLPRYKRPTNNELQKASEFFIYHYVHQSGELSDWRNTLQILLLGLSINHNNLPVYILANEDERKAVDSEIQLPWNDATTTVPEYKNDHSFKKSANKWQAWCYSELIRGNIAVVSNYLGLISLYLCSQSVAAATDVNCDFTSIRELLRTHFSTGESSWPITPLPGKTLFKEFKVIFNYSEQFTKELICRVTQRRLQISRVLPMNLQHELIKIQDAACYRSFEERGAGLWILFERAQNILRVKDETLLNRLSELVELKDSVEALKSITPFHRTQKTWVIANLLQKTAYSNLCINNIENLLMIATCFVIVYNITDKNNEIWTHQIFAFDRLRQDGLLKRAISVGQSLRREVKLNTKPKAQHVVTTKEKSKFTEWTDNLFVQLYWLPLPRYKRPTNNELQKASEFFIYHYVHQSGELSDWRNTLQILLLGLSINHKNRPVYILANEDERKAVDSEIQLPWNDATTTVPECKNDHSFKKSANKWQAWCYSELIRGNIAVVSNYLGLISLYLCSQSVANATDVNCDFTGIIVLLRTHFSTGESSWPITPLPGKTLFKEFKVIFNYSEQFAKQLICRVAQRRLQISRVLPTNLQHELIKIQDAACYRRFEECGTGLWLWFTKAKIILKVKDETLFNRLSKLVELKDSVEALKSITSSDRKQKTWVIANLLQKSAYSNLCINNIENLLMIATCFVIVYNITDKNNEIWTHQIFAFDRLRQEGLLEKAISMGQSLRREVKLNTKPKTNNCIGETQQVVTTKEESKFTEWTDNLFVQLYWLPLPRYKRPTNNELQKASEFFIYHYVHQSGELSDWRNTLQILLLGLSINRKNRPVYILANEDERKAVDSEIQLPWNDATTTVPEYKNDHSFKKSANKWQAWCYSELIRGNIAVVSNYLGLISLYLCSQSVPAARDVSCDFIGIIVLLRTHFSTGKSSWPITPLPGKILFKEFKVIFNYSEQFAKQLICRVAQRRLQIKQELPMKFESAIIVIQNVAFYKRFEERGDSMWHWFCRAKGRLNVSGETLLEMLTVAGITPFDLKQQTWPIASLLRNEYYSNLSVKKIENLLTIAIFMVVYYNITDKNNEIWTHQIFAFDRLRQEGLLERAISVGQSVRHEVKLNTKPKTNNCIGETQQVVTTKEKSNITEWTDNLFVQLYWLPLPRYKRPTNNELQKASEFFIYHYVHQSGELSDWRNTLQILLLGLSINHKNRPVYILANEDERKAVDSEIQLPWNDATTTVPEYKNDHSFKKSANKWQAWCYSELIRGNIAVVSNYLGLISLYLCSQSVAAATDVNCDFTSIRELLRTHFSTGESSWPITPLPGKTLFKEFKVIFNYSEQFTKELICRVTQRRLQISRVLRKNLRRKLIKIQDAACYRSFEERGAGLWILFERAQNILRVKHKTLFNRLTELVELKDSVEALKSITPFVRKQKTWVIANLLQKSAYYNLCINNIENLLMIATCFVIVYNITDKNNEMWTHQIFAFERLRQEGLLERAISVGQSLRREVKLNTKPKTNNCIGETQQVVTTKEKSNITEWTDNLFVQLYWLPLPRYKRPTNNELQKASEFFIYHYVHQSGELSDWRNTLQILLLGLSINHNNLPVYILANEDERKAVDSEIQLPWNDATTTVPEYKNDHSFKKSANKWQAWCYSELIRGNIAVVSNYLGLISLYLCSQSVAAATDVNCDFTSIRELLRTHFSTGESSWPITPLPGKTLFKEFKVIFNYSEQFTKELICRVTQRRLQISRVLPMNLQHELIKIQDAACYRSFEERGAGLWILFERAQNILKVKHKTLFNRLSKLVELKDSVEALKSITSSDRKQKTWVIANLLQKSAYSNLCINNIENLLMIATCFVIVYNITDKNNEIWTHQIFAFDRLRQEGLLERAISVGQSLRREVKLNTKPKTNNCIGETQQVVTTKEKSNITEWTDNLFVQLYWLPLPRYKRPTNNELQKASEFFIYHYVHQSGELSDWRNTLQILLLGLSINHNNLPVYILANEDERKAVDSEIQLPWNDATTTVPEYKNDHSFKKSANKWQAWCYSELIRGNIAVVSNYLGLISLYLCSQSVAAATDVNCDFTSIRELLRTHFSTGESSWPITPLPGKTLFKEFKVIFNYSEQFTKELICRVTQRRLQISRVLPMNLQHELIKIQDAACYRSFEERGAGLWILFERAQTILKVKHKTLFNRLTELVELMDSVEALKSITRFDRKQKTWVIANLLQKSAYSNLCINNIENLLMIATCFVIVYNITDKNNEIWTHQIFAFDRLRQEGLLERAISVGQSLRREVKLNTKPKTNNCVGETQQVVTTKEKSNITEWTDNLFVQLYWLPLPRYKRPTNNELQKASEFFIYHYVHQSGELSDWRNTLHILLLGLSINHNNLPVYILANEDELKAVDSEIQLPWNDATTTLPEYKNDHSFKKSANKWQAWCYSELIRGNIAVVSNYLGLISLYLCSQSVAAATDVSCDFTGIIVLLQTHFSTGESSWPRTPLPGKTLFKAFKVIFNYSEQFAKQLICRVAQRRLQIKQELPMKFESAIIVIQNVAFYKRFEEHGDGMWHWFCRAKGRLNVSGETLLEMLTVAGITPFDLKQQTWPIASLLRNEYYSNLGVKKIENLLAIAIFMVVYYNITDKNNKIWTNRCFEFDRLKQEGLLERAISVGQSLRREVKLNTKPKTNNCIGETHQVVTTKEKSKFSEWTDNLFVQLYWLPLPRYKRPTNNELQKASEFFIYHYVHQSGELSDWRNTLQILLLGLSINHNNLPVYILANEDERKAVDSEIQLPWNDAYTMVPFNNRENRSYNWRYWCYYELSRGNIADVSNYLGRISLFFCRLAVAPANDVRYNFKRVLENLEVRWPIPAWPSEALFQKFSEIFNCNTQFAKELICRLVQRRLQIRQVLPKNLRRELIEIQDAACYRRFEERGAGLWLWFTKAKKILKVGDETLFNRLTKLVELKDSVEALKSITPFDRKQKTWVIANLLQKSAYSNLCINNIENLLMIATCFVIVYNITDKNNEIWTHQIFAFDRLRQEGLLKRAISVGQSLRREVKLNTKPQTNNYIGETQQVVTTKEKSKFSEWTDNLFVQLYWLPLPRYKRPTNNELQKASEFFIYHYVHQSGELSDWRNTLQILLLGLSINHNNLPVYILANEDERKAVDSEIQLPWNDAYTMVPFNNRENRSYNWRYWCYYELSRGNIADVSNYLGRISLFFCRLAVAPANDVRYNFKRVLENLEVRWPIPAWPSEALFQKFSEIFNCNTQFAKELICRLVQRRLQIRQVLPKNLRRELIEIQDAACYRRFEERGAGLWLWFTKAKKILKVGDETLFNRLTKLVELKDSVEALKSITPFDRKQKTWVIANLLQKSAYSNLCINNIENLLMIATCFVIVYNITDKNNEMWTHQIFAFERLRQEGLLERAISVGQSLRREVKLNTKPKTNNCIGETQQVVTTKEKSNITEWTDNLFVQLYWLPLPRYKRPTNNELQKASEFFIYHYVHQSGELSDWRNTLQILLLGLSINHKNRPVYILANEDERKAVDSEIQLPWNDATTTVPECKNDHSFKKSANKWQAWCYSELIRGNIAVVSNYLGLISLYLCSQSVANATDVNCDFTGIIVLLRTHFSTGESSWPITPLPGKTLFKEFKVIFNYSEQFAKQLICRVAQRRLQISRVLPTNLQHELIKIQDAACYRRFEECGTGLWLWFTKAKIILKVKDETLFNRLSKLVELKDSVEALKSITSSDRKQKTWVIANLLQKSAYSNLCINNIENLLMIATCFVIVYNITDKNNEMWTHQIFAFERLRQEGLLERAISVGQSLRREVKLNTKPKTNNCIGETQQVVTTKEKSNITEWTDNLFVQLYWLPLPRYKRPTNNELQKASEFFIYHYVHQSGELSDWRNTLQILLLGLSINHNNLPVYILANEDERKAVDSEIQLPWNDATTTVPEYKNDHSFKKSANKWQAWCYSELIRGNIAVVSNYLGLISLYLCSQSVAAATDVNCDFTSIRELLRTHFSTGESSWPITPLPGKTLFKEFKVIFNYSEQFTKELICRVTQRRLQISRVLRKNLRRKLIKIQDAACYRSFEERGAGLWILFERAQNILRVKHKTLFNRLTELVELKDSVEALKSITPFVRKQKTWVIANLLQKSAYYNLCINNIENLLMIATCFVIVYNITDKNNEMWTHQIFAFERLRQEGLLERAISVGQSLRREVKLNTKPKTNNCIGETQQVVTTKEKSNITEWTDNLFVQLYWLPLPRYKRPTNNELQKASEFFIYHYVHQSGELSDWRNTLQILLLGLSINHNNLPVYILANEDERKAVDSEIQLPWNDATTTVPEYKNDHSFKKSANKWQAWCYSELIRGNIAVVSNYLGLISLYLCSQSVAAATDVNCDFTSIRELLRTHFSTGESSWPITPLPGKTLFKEFKVIFNYSEQFTKELICRVTQRRLQISRVLPMNLQHELIKIQDAACYRSFEERGAGLWILFERAQNILKVKHKTLFNRLSKLVELKDSVEALKSITSSDRKQKTWVIANLLQKSAYSNLCINNIENLLMIATCFVIVYNITDKNNEIWTHQIFAFDRLRQEGLLERAISVGQSLRREVKLNTKPKTNNCIGETQQVVTTKEKSNITEWTDNLFVQLYWLPLPRYKRPTNNELQKASEFFIYHYVHQSGELSDWRNTLQILLLGLSINHNNLPVYILANEDERKAVDSEIQLPWNDATTTVPEYKNDHSFKKSANKWQAWCYSELIRGNIAVVSNYLGLISLYLCSQSVAAATDVSCDFTGIIVLLQTHFSTGESSWPRTPLPGKTLFKAFKVIFNYSEQFAKQLICRVAQRRLQIKQELPMKFESAIIVIQNVAFYKRFEEHGDGMWHWFCRAKGRLNVSGETLLEMLTVAGITPFDLKQQTWPIASLLRNEYYSNLGVKKIENLLAIAIFMVVYYNITDKNNKIWTNRCFEFDRLKQEGLLERAISVGQSLRREVKLNTKPKTNNCIGETHQVVTTKEKSKFSEWTDNLFVQLYWLPLPRYKRPTNNELQKASEFFIYHYVHQSGELSDWRNTLQILLLGLSINHNNLPVYILANEDERKAVDSEIQLPWNDAYTMVPFNNRENRSYNWRYWCYYELSRGNIADVSNYLGRISLFFCRLAVAPANDVRYNFKRVLENLEVRWPIPAWPSEALFQKFSEIFNCNTQFAKELICRLVQRRLQIRQVLPKNLRRELIEIQDAACYRRFEERGAGLWLWFTKAKKILKVGDETLFNRLTKLVELKDSVEALKSITPFDRKQKTWVIANLLQKSAYSNLCINNIENLLMIATCFVIVYNITDKNNEMWTHQIFSFDRLRQEGLLERAISVGQSLRREVKLNTKPKTNNCTRETQQVVTTKEKSKFTEWTDNLFVQLYWLPLPRYKRPTNNELQKASEFFIYHYVHQSGELSDWRNTLQILLLGLSINHNNLPVYILANEDERKAVDSEIQLPWNDATTTVPEYKNDHSFKKSANKWQAWCYSELIRGNIAVVSNYLGLISLYLCSQSVAAATDVNCDFRGVTKLLRTHFSTGESSWPITPLPGKTLFKEFKVIFNYSEQFTKELICRVTQRRLQISRVLPMNLQHELIKIQDAACYRRFAECGTGLWLWFTKAKKILKVKDETLFNRLTKLVELKDSVEALKSITPFDRKQKTWVIANLLQKSAYSNLCINNIENLLMIATCFVIVYNITDKNNEMWTHQIFAFDRLRQEGLLERAISVGQSLRCSGKLNTTSKVNTSSGKMMDARKVKKSNILEWSVGEIVIKMKKTIGSDLSLRCAANKNISYGEEKNSNCLYWSDDDEFDRLDWEQLQRKSACQLLGRAANGNTKSKTNISCGEMKQTVKTKKIQIV